MSSGEAKCVAMNPFKRAVSKNILVFGQLKIQPTILKPFLLDHQLNNKGNMLQSTKYHNFDALLTFVAITAVLTLISSCIA